MSIKKTHARVGVLLLSSAMATSACDSQGETFTFLAPLTANAKFTVAEDNHLVGDIDTGSKGDAVRVRISVPPAHGTVNVLTANPIDKFSFEYVPAQDYNGNDSFTYVIDTPISGHQTSATASIAVTPVNDAPVAFSMTKVGPRNTVMHLEFQGVDVDNDDSSLRYTVTQSPQHGTIFANGGNSFDYLPEAGFAGDDSLVFQVKDPDGLASTGNATLRIEDVFSKFKPALAVRAMGCITCHSNINANVITDYGYGGDGLGHDYFFNGSSRPLGIYGNWDVGWASANILGKVIVPQTSFASNYLSGNSSTSLAQYLQTLGRTDGLPTLDVQEKSHVYIGSATEGAVLDAAGNFDSADSKWKYTPQIAGGVALSGLRVSANGLYVENDPSAEFKCAGDLFIRGILFLNNAKLRTDGYGCRIYATESVFIQGAVTYLGTDPYRNLQIASARAITLGMGRVMSDTPTSKTVYVHGACDGAVDAQGRRDTIRCRLNHSLVQTQAHSRAPADLSTAQKIARIIADGDKVPDLSDVVSHGVGADEATKRNVVFERLLLSAPYVLSRYQGDFKGVVIGEVAIFSLGQFKFDYDTVFDRTSILPKLNSDSLLKVDE